MTSRTPKVPPSPGPAKGYPIVIGPRSALHRYCDQPWAEIEVAARDGRDGLRLTTEGATDDSPADQEFKLREMPVPVSSAFYGFASLVQQRW